MGKGRQISPPVWPPHQAMLPRQGTGKTRCSASLSFVNWAGQIYSEEFVVCLSMWGLRICSSGWISTVPTTLYSCCNNPAVYSWTKCKETILFLILSVLSLISIYRDSRADVNQARLVEGKDLWNECFKYVCTLTYKLLKYNRELLGVGQEMLFLQYFPHGGLRLPSIAAVSVWSRWVILNKSTSFYS